MPLLYHIHLLKFSLNLLVSKCQSLTKGSYTAFETTPVKLSTDQWRLVRITPQNKAPKRDTRYMLLEDYKQTFPKS